MTGCGQLRIIGISAQLHAAGLNVGDNGGSDRAAVVHHVGDRLTDDVIQRQHDQQRDKRPQAAAAHRNALVLVELGKRDLIFLLVVAVFFFERLGHRGQTRHLEHALLALDAHRQKHELDDQGKQDQRHAIVVGEAVKPVEQVAEGDADNVGNAHFVLRGVERSLGGLRRGHARSRVVSRGCAVHGTAGQREEHKQCEDQCKGFFHELSSSVGMPSAGQSPDGLRHRVKIVAPVKGVAPQKPPQRQNAALPRAIPFDRLQRVLGAGRGKAAAGRKCRRNVLLIKPDQAEQQLFHSCASSWSRESFSASARYAFSSSA